MPEADFGAGALIGTVGGLPLGAGARISLQTTLRIDRVTDAIPAAQRVVTATPALGVVFPTTRTYARDSFAAGARIVT